MLTWILGSAAVLFLILWLTKKPKKDGGLQACNADLAKARNEATNFRAQNLAYAVEVTGLKQQLGKKQRELIQTISELRECKVCCEASCNQTRPPLDIEEVIDKEESKTKPGRLPFFEIFKDSTDDFRWRFKAKNNKIVADSGEGYTTKQNLKKGMAAFMTAISTGDYNTKWTDGTGPKKKKK
jgi:uncharacterized protein YegP (UPF0339 family)